MRSNRTKSPQPRSDAAPPDALADRWRPAPKPRRKQSVLLPVVTIVLGVAIVSTVAYAASVLLNLHPGRFIAGLLQKTTASAPPAQSPASPRSPQAATEATRPSAPQPATPTEAARPRVESRFPRPFALWRTIPYSLTDDVPDQPQPFQQMRAMTGDLQYIDGSAFQTENTLVRLSGITSLAREAICIGDNKAKFACGLMARASLSLLVAPERPRCYPDVSLATSDPAWLCTSRGHLLSTSQIEAGFALPSQPSIDFYVELAAKARANHVGAWNGDWTVISQPGGSP